MGWEELFDEEPKINIKTKFDDFEVPEYVKYVKKYPDGNTCWILEDWYAEEEHRKMILFDNLGRKFSDSYLDKLEESRLEKVRKEKEKKISQTLRYDYQNSQTFIENFSNTNDHFGLVLAKLFMNNVEENEIFEIANDEEFILIEKNVFVQSIRDSLTESDQILFDSDFLLKNSETIFDENKITILVKTKNKLFVSYGHEKSDIFWKMLIKKEGVDDYVSGWFLKINRSFFDLLKTEFDIKDIQRAHIVAEGPKEIELKSRLIKSVKKIE